MRKPWTRLGCYASTVVLGLCGLTITLSSLSAHAQPVGTTALYRLWNGRDHFYTTGCDEKWTAVRDAGYVLEGIQAYIATQHTSSTTPLFRMFHPNGDHFYTASAPETEFAKTLGYHSEGVAGFISPTQGPGTTPLFRMYNPTLPDHFYTTGSQERDSAKLNGWSDEGIAGYVLATGDVTCPKFPMRFIARDGEHVGPGHHMTTELTVSENGRLDSITTTDNRVALNGFCGNVSFYFLDGNGNVLGEFGMPRDHQWCVDGSGIPLRPSKRTDRMTQMVPKEVLDKTAAVSILHVETPGKNALRDIGEVFQAASEYCRNTLYIPPSCGASLTCHSEANGSRTVCTGSCGNPREPVWDPEASDWCGTIANGQCVFDFSGKTPGSYGGAPGGSPSTGQSCQAGSIIRPDSQNVGESVPLVGTPFRLVYFTDRVMGRTADYTLHIPLDDVLGRTLTFSYLGRTESPTSQATAGASYDFLWDGNDATGQPYPGGTAVTVTMETRPSLDMGTFCYVEADGSQTCVYIPDGLSTLDDLPFIYTYVVGSYKAIVAGLGGWTLSAHHFYDATKGMLYFGDGSSRQVTAQRVNNNTRYRAASDDGAEVYLFDRRGTHLQTLNGLTGAVLYRFAYDTHRRLLLSFAITSQDPTSGARSVQMSTALGRASHLALEQTATGMRRSGDGSAGGGADVQHRL